MPTPPLSRYRDLPTLRVVHATRGVTQSLPVRRPPLPDLTAGARRHRVASGDTGDLLALKYLGREDLYWHLMDYNAGKLPEDQPPGASVVVPPLALVTRVNLPGA